MKKRITDIISIDSSLAMPVYKQIVQSIHRCIEKGWLTQNDMLPSVNSISETFSMARGSVFTAYNDLRAAGIIDSVPGKGYFIKSTRIHQKKKIFLLMNDFSCSGAALYNSLLRQLPEGCTMDVYFHHNDIGMFETVISEQCDRYNVFVMVPLIHKDTVSVLSRLENKQVFLLDSGYKEYRKFFNGLFQNHERMMYDVLLNFQQGTGRYNRLFLVISNGLGSKEFVSGFNKFSRKFSLNTAVIDRSESGKIKRGDGLIVTTDEDLVEIMRYANSCGYKAGVDIGIISFSENILKSLIHDGITTVEPDFVAGGQMMTSMIFSGNGEVMEMPVIIKDRKSF